MCVMTLRLISVFLLYVCMIICKCERLCVSVYTHGHYKNSKTVGTSPQTTSLLSLEYLSKTTETLESICQQEVEAEASMLEKPKATFGFSSCLPQPNFTSV